MKIGIIICDRYRTCGAGKCLRAMRERAGAFSRYPADEPLELVGFSTCAGCPGGNVEYVPEEMVKNGVERRYGVPVVAGRIRRPRSTARCIGPSGRGRRSRRTRISWPPLTCAVPTIEVVAGSQGLATTSSPAGNSPRAISGS